MPAETSIRFQDGSIIDFQVDNINVSADGQTITMGSVGPIMTTMAASTAPSTTTTNPVVYMTNIYNTGNTTNGFYSPPNPFEWFTAPNTQDTCLGGHEANEELTEYLDGIVVTNCKKCNVRLILPRVPGGLAFLRVKALLAGVMDLDESRLSELLGEFTLLRDAFQVDEDALKEAKKLLDIALGVLNAKVNRGELNAALPSAE